jgi:hypothetical protein
LYEKAVRDGVMPKAARRYVKASRKCWMKIKMDAQEALQKASELITDMKKSAFILAKNIRK